MRVFVARWRVAGMGTLMSMRVGVLDLVMAMGMDMEVSLRPSEQEPETK
jgi:hypothetical protein